MPDEKGVLSHEDRVKAAQFINEKAKHEGDPCPHCGCTDTNVSEDLFRLAVANAPIPRGYIPVIPVGCSNCGFIRLFSGQTLGIEMPESTRPPADQEGDE